ncbi:MAG: peptide ABC transporter substrate-binding protein [Candidatus Baltobacteraceae bacterium]
MNRRRCVRVGAVAFAALLCACSKGGQAGSGTALVDESKEAPAASARVNTWTKPHVLRFTSSEDITTLNPVLNTQGVLLRLSEMTMAWLIKWDHSNNATPELATQVPTQANGGVSKDGLTITYHIRRGVRWSDGAAFDADDVVFSFRAVLNPQNNVVSRSGWDRIASIEEPDKFTVVLHLKKPYSPFVETFFSSAGANPCLLPKHILGALPNINNAPYNALPVGIGPFKYQKWERSQRVVMVANPLYFRGMPKLHEVDYEVIPDLNTTLTELQAKQLDLWYPTPGSFFVSKMQGMRGFAFIRQPGYLFNHISFNVRRPALRDPAVRLALKYAADRATLIQKVGHGVGILQDEPAPNTAPYWDPKIALTPFDMAKANALLQSAGWQKGPDGIRAKGGVKLSLEFVTNTGNPTGDQIIELLRAWWKQIGVDLTVKRYAANLLFASYQDNGPLYRGNWDVAFFAWGLGATGDESNLFACDQVPPAGQNILHWCNRRADQAMHALYAHYDQAQRNADDAILFEEINKDVPMIVANGREDIFFFNADLKGYRPGGVAPFDDMMNVDI